MGRYDAPERVEDAAEVIGRRLRLRIWPEQFERLVAVELVPLREGEQLEQGGSLAKPPSGVLDDPPADADLEAAEQPDADTGIAAWSET